MTASDTIETAIVRWFNPDLGYGFLIPSKFPHAETYFHANMVLGRAPQKGDRCSLKIGKAKDGRNFAYDVTVLNEENSLA